MDKQEFTEKAHQIAQKFGISINIIWDKPLIEFKGELEGDKWDLITSELNQLMEAT